MMKNILLKSEKMKHVEHVHGEPLEELLRRLFVDDNLSKMEIAQRLSLSYVTVIKWLQLAGVRGRKLHILDES